MPRRYPTLLVLVALGACGFSQEEKEVRRDAVVNSIVLGATSPAMLLEGSKLPRALEAPAVRNDVVHCLDRILEATNHSAVYQYSVQERINRSMQSEGGGYKPSSSHGGVMTSGVAAARAAIADSASLASNTDFQVVQGYWRVLEFWLAQAESVNPGGAASAREQFQSFVPMTLQQAIVWSRDICGF